MTNSMRTKLWMQNNPEKAAAMKERARARKVARQSEAIAALKRAKYKSPIAAIHAFCTACPRGMSRAGFDKAPVTCSMKNCPLYCFRNGNPVSIARGRKLNNLVGIRNKSRIPVVAQQSCAE